MRFLTWVLSGVLVAGCAFAEPVVEGDPDLVLGPEAFAEKVAEAGGRVDFVFGDDRPHKECHASSIVECADGSLITTWFGGTKEKDDDVGIWYARFTDGAWGPITRAAKVNETAHWNPVLFRDAEDQIHLFFKVGPEIPHWQTYWMTSDDHGATWSEPKELVKDDKGGRGPVRCKPIILSDGSWLAGASTEYKGWKPFADRSTDQGATWTRSENFEVDRQVLRGLGAIQPTLWESKPGHVHTLMRSQNGLVWRTDSKDYGQTWDTVSATELPNNNSGIDTVLLDDGRLVLIYNPVGKNWGPRTPLDLAYSKDNGKTWQTIAHLENDPGKDVEFSYPAMVRTKDGIAVSYTWNRERIRTWQIPLDALPE